MSLIAEVLARVTGWALRVVLLAAAAVFTLSLLVAGLLVATFLLLRALLTGRRPEAARVWGRFRAVHTRTPWSRPTGARGRSSAQVVDVEAREVATGAGRPRSAPAGLPPSAP